MKKRPEYVYQERRRIASALCISVLAVIGDVSAENGTGLPVLSAFGFFFILTTGPLVLGKVLDLIAESKETYNETGER